MKLEEAAAENVVDMVSRYELQNSSDVISRQFTEAKKLRPAVLSEHWWSCVLGLSMHSSNLVGKELRQLVSGDAG